MPVAWSAPPVPGGDDYSGLPDVNLDLTAVQPLVPTGNDALGDSVDLYNGSLSFSHTDVSLPGNSSLSVAITRRFRGASYNAARLEPAKAFGTWELAVPRITTQLSTISRWAADRCTGNFAPPPVKVSNLTGSIVEEDYYWSGYQVELPQGAVTMLSPAVFPLPPSFTRVAAGGIGFECTTAHDVNGNAAGEGFIARTPDGVSYVFDLLTAGPAPSVKAGYNVVHRYTAILLATSATDRFGNSVQYQYDTAARLIGITANDGRSITVGWTTLGTGEAVISQVTAGSRSWTYEYTTANGAAELTGVVWPDSSRWQFSLWNLYSFFPGSPLTPGPVFGSVTSPFGLNGVFELNTLVNGYGAYSWPSPDRSPGFRTAALAKKTLSGPNVAPATWAYIYNAPSGWSAIGGSGSATRTTQVVQPSQESVRYTFSMLYDWSEGALRKIEYLDSSGTLWRQIDKTYEAGPLCGTSLNKFRNGQTDAGMARTTSVMLTQNGNTYLEQSLSFDAYNNVTQVQRSNSFATPSIVETHTFVNSQSLWVIGKHESTTIGGVSVSNRLFTPLVQPQEDYAFGLRSVRANYYSDGQLYQVRDELNRITSFSDYYRGSARRVENPDASAQTRELNEFGEVVAVTNVRGHTTTLSRDSLGRVKAVNYPTGDTVSWAPQSIEYSFVAELGLSSGTLRQRITQGRARISTYFDAFLRPVVIESADTVTGKVTYSRKAYDSEGRVAFEAYPSSSSAATTGINFVYDPLGRLKQRVTTDGVVLETISYLSGNRKQVTDADGRTTTVTYQAFSSPDYTNPLRIEAPENRTTVFQRDVYGKVLSATQSGSWTGGFSSATRTWEYDTYQRLCRSTEPETASTIYGLDAASQIAWEAKGQSGIGCVVNAPATATQFKYDLLGRKTLDDFPGVSDDVSFGYEGGNLTSVTNATATWAYIYNKRDLLEKETATIDGKTFVLDPTFDAQGNVSQKTLPDSTTINYAPDAWGRPTQASSYVSGVQYYPSGQVSSYSLGNDMSYSQTLDTRLRPWTQQTSLGATIVQKFVYGYSTGSDITSVTGSVANADDATYSYDGLHRVATASGLWGAYSYTYDTLNNIRSRGGVSNLAYAYDTTANRLSGVSGATTRSYSYNANGDVTGDGARTFTLNSRGQITGITSTAPNTFDPSAYTVIGGDYNGDGIADILLQRNIPGDSYIVFGTGSASYPSIIQTIAQNQLGLTWSADQRKAVTGDFNGDGRTDLFLQATSPSGTSAIVLADANGQFTSAPTQTFRDGDLGFKWSTKNMVISVGNFGGPVSPTNKPTADLLFQPKPNIVMISYTIAIAVPAYAPGSFGVAFSAGGTTPFQVANVQRWNRVDSRGINWAPTLYTAVVGDYVGANGIADVILKAKSATSNSYLVTANGSGAAFSAATTLAPGATWPTDNYSLQPGYFNTNASSGFFQALLPGNSTYYFDGNGKRIKAIKSGVTEYTIYSLGGSMAYSEKGSEKTSYIGIGSQAQVELKNVGGTITPTYLHADWQGSPRKASSAAGASLWSETYEPFGKKMNGVAEKVGYTGHADDAESGLTYAQARYYDPVVGRFLSPDPVRMTDDFGLYSYVGNNPINATDPTGQFSDLLYYQALKQAGKMYLTEAGVALADGPEPGLADVFAVGMAVGTTIGLAVDVGIAVFSDDATPAKADSNTQRVDAADKAEGVDRTSTLKPGPNAKESIPAGTGAPTAAEQREINKIGDQNGCHTCGTTTPGTKSGNWVGDHQPSKALATPKAFYPHCLGCARRQGGQVRQEKRKLDEEKKK
jgi:RHS repeat-associated protein